MQKNFLNTLDLAMFGLFCHFMKALWRGVNVRRQMKKVQDEYVKLFKELENGSALEVQWTSVLSRPKFLSYRDKRKSSKAAQDTEIQSNHPTVITADVRLFDEIPELDRPTHTEDVVQFSTKLMGDAETQTSMVANSLEHHGVLTDAHLTPSNLINPSVSQHETGNKHQGHGKFNLCFYFMLG